MATGPKPGLDFLAGGGEMGGRIRELDWSRTPIGAVETWSPALRMMVPFLLANRFPLLLWWGPEYVSVYNDAYRPVLGEKHPWGLGKPVSECWSEIWDVLQPLIDTPFHGGPATWNEDIALEINRHGFLEETHFTIAYSPVPDETVASGIGGVLATVHEISDKVVAQRRVVALRDVGGQIAAAKTAEEVCKGAARALATHGKDVPFALFYLLDGTGATAHLVAAAGVEPGVSAAPAQIDLAAPGGWLWSDAMEAGSLQIVDGLSGFFEGPPAGPWKDPPTRAVIAPIPASAPHEFTGVMIAGVSSRLEFDEYYREFVELLKTRVATGIINARALEEETRRAEALAQLDRAKTAFFSNVSHEFRTPLTLMLGPVEEILAKAESAVAAEARPLLLTVQRNGTRLLKLVNTLLDFARLEAGRAQATYEPVDLAALTTDLASTFRAACERAGLRLDVDCPPLAEPAYVDREMWEKIVLNLLSNAFKFTLAGAIRVGLHLREEGFVLTVSDTGTGIPASEMPRMFERFHRVEGAVGRSHEGSGIGLALVHEFVKLHGASIAVESALGVGSTFTVVIPRGMSHLPADRVAAPDVTSNGTARRAGAYVDEALSWIATDEAEVTAEPGSARILVVDDNADLREYVRRLLAEYYEVETAPDGLAALSAARTRRPDLVVTDVMMPRLDGFGLIRALRDDDALRDLPVLVLSARAGEEARLDGLEHGADGYVAKPFTARELLVRVGSLLQSADARRKAFELERRAAAQFKTLLDQAPLGVVLVDADFRIRAVNPIGRPAFGDIPGGVIGRDLAEIMHLIWPSHYADEIAALFRHTLHTGESFFTPERAEFRIDRGVTEYYEWRLDRIPLPDGSHGVVCYFRDISPQVMARKAIEESREALREADRRKDEFLATLSHELRNPLAPLRNALHLMRLADPAPGVSTGPIQDIMERQVDQLVRLVDDLLEVSRISQGGVELRKEHIDLNTVVRYAIESSALVFRNAGHRLTAAIPDSSFWVKVDPARVGQVLTNLLANAAKFTEPGGEISVAVRRDHREVLVVVRDSGIGISPDVMPRLFHMFSRGAAAKDPSRSGMGIGLALARRLTEMHGGMLTARSEGVGRGSEFTVRLPLSEEPPPASAPGATTPSVVKPHRILVVDDNADAAASVGMLLKFLGAEVRVTHDGPAALAEFATFDPSIVVLDLGLPGMSGYEVARLLRTGYPDRRPAIVALSGWGQESERRRTKDAGFDHHLVKPADVGVLRTLLESIAVAQ